MDEKVKDVKDEIGAMLDSFNGVVEEDDPNKDVSDVDDKDVDKDDADDVGDKDKDDSGDVDKDKDDSDADDKDSDSDKDDKEDKDDKDDEPDEKDKIIDDLRTKLADKEKVDDADKDKDEDKEEKPLVFEDQDFIGELDLDELVRDPKEFNKLLNTLYQKAVTDTRQVLGEGVLRSIPDIVKANIEIMSNLKKASDDFYADNEDLKPFKRVVAAVFEDLASQNPDKNYNDIIDDVGAEVRKRLELHKKAEVKDDKKKDEKGAPKLPRKKGKSGSADDKPNLSPMQDELAEMNKTLGR